MNSLFWKRGQDIRIFGILLIAAGTFDLIWIASYPQYALKVFGTTFDGWLGEVVKYQHPFIHWLLGYGFWKLRLWAFAGYLAYLAVACFSEGVTQLMGGFNTTRTTMIIVSLLVGAYIIFRRPVFSTHAPVTN